jgi:hypothetical protein
LITFVLEVELTFFDDSFNNKGLNSD